MKKGNALTRLSAVAVLMVFAVAGFGCAALPSANSGAEEGIIIRPEQNTEREGVELVLYPVAVWGDKDASAPVATEVGGREVYLRKRRGRWLDRARAKMGLFWNSRGDDIYLLVAVSGPPAYVRGVRVHYGGDDGGLLLADAGNVRLIPGRNIWDGGDGKTPAVYAIKPEVFADMLAAEESRVSVDIGDGLLELDLGALGDDSSRAAHENAKVLFWQFYDKMMQIQKQ